MVGEKGQSLKVGGPEPASAVAAAMPIGGANGLTADDKEVIASPRIGSYAWYALALLAAAYCLSYIDRQIFSILAEDVKRDMRLTDPQIGVLYGTAFALFYAVFGIPLARLADRGSRTWLIAVGLWFWSAMTACSGLAQNYTQLALSRMGVGVGEATLCPAAYSLIGDYFPKWRRGLAIAIFAVGANFGGGLSLPIGGTIASSWNRSFGNAAPLGLAGWQVAFLAVCLPGLLLGVWVATLREPARGAWDGVNAPPVRSGALKQFLREVAEVVPPLTLVSQIRYRGGLRANVILLVAVACVATTLILVTHDVAQWIMYGVGAYAVGSWVQSLKHEDPVTWKLTWGNGTFVILVVSIGCLAALNFATSFWSAPYLLRTFYTRLDAPGHLFSGLSAREEVGYLQLGSTVGAMIGSTVGGWLSDRWGRKGIRGRVAVIALSASCYAPLLATLFSTNDLIVFVSLQPLVAAVGVSFWPSAFAVVQEMVLPRMRATASALVLLASTMIGLATGPYLTGKLAMISGSLSVGIYVLCVLCPVVLVALWWVSRPLPSIVCRVARQAVEMDGVA